MSKRIHVRPGRGQSKMGFVVGIIFCFIGLFLVIPTFGLFGVFWTAVAGWITYVNYKNGFTNEQIDSHVIEIEDDGRDVTVTKHSVNLYNFCPLLCPSLPEMFPWYL